MNVKKLVLIGIIITTICLPMVALSITMNGTNDFNEISAFSTDYSYGTLFRTKDSHIQSENGDELFEPNSDVINPKYAYYVDIGQRKEFKITNCSLDQDGDMCDVTVSIENIRPFEYRPEREGKEGDAKIDITEYNGLIQFGLSTWDAEVLFRMEYTKHETGDKANIPYTVSTVYDLDASVNAWGESERFVNEIFEGNEGVAIPRGEIYYDKTEGRLIDGKISGGIWHGVSTTGDKNEGNTDGIQKRTSAVIAEPLTNSNFDMLYAGRGCTIYYVFTSPYAFYLGNPVKTVSKDKVYENETYEYTISQYVPNNYYTSQLKFIDNSDGRYRSFVIEDILDDNLNVEKDKIRIENEEGTDVTNQFEIRFDGNTMQVRSHLGGEKIFYGHLYKIIIPVSVKEGSGIKVEDGKIRNSAQTVATSDNLTETKNTSTVEVSLKYKVLINSEIDHGKTNIAIINNGTGYHDNSASITMDNIEHGDSSSYAVYFQVDDGYQITGCTIDGKQISVDELTLNASGNYYIYTIKDENIRQDIEHNIVITTVSYGYIQAIKKDSVTKTGLKDVQIGIYTDSTCQELVQTLITGADGTAKSNQLSPNKTYYVKEIKAPANYVMDETAHATIVKPGETSTVEILNEPYGDIQVIKKDSNTKEVLQGAQISIYTDSTCQKLVQTLTTDSNGTATSKLLEPNKTYYVKETKAPANYVLNNTVKATEVKPGDTTQVVIENNPNTAQVEVVKKDEQTKNTIITQDTTFVLYEWDARTNQYVRPTHIDTNTFNGTVSDGGYILKEKISGTKGTYTGTMYYNATNQGKFKVVEYSRPFGYVNSNWSKEFTITSNNQIFSPTTDSSFAPTNKEVKGTINFKKIDSEVNYTNTDYGENYAQGDATLKGATYALYAKEDIRYPDTGQVRFNAGDQVSVQKTDENGKITWSDLYLGKYYIQETIASEGYIEDERPYEVDLTDYYQKNYYDTGNQTTANIVYQNTTTDAQYENTEKRVISKETVKKQGFRLTKFGKLDNETEMHPLENAGFKIYLIKNLTQEVPVDRDGKYIWKDIDFTKEEQAIALDFSENGNGKRIDELFTNKNGVIESPALAYGDYVVVETTVPENYEPINPFVVNITEDNDVPQEKYQQDSEFNAIIKVIKKDDATGQTVLKPNASYLIRNTKTGDLITQTISYKGERETFGTEDNPWKTGEKGWVETVEPLTPGEYELIEIAAPEGYVLAEKSIPFSINSNEVYDTDTDLEEQIIIVKQENKQQVGTITVSKIGEFLSEAKEKEQGYHFEYEDRYVKDAEFTLYANEDIYTQDNQGEQLYSKGEIVQVVSTNGSEEGQEEGKAKFTDLPLGKYYIEETIAGEGFTLNTETKEVELTYEGQDKAVIYRDVEYINERQKIKIDITKKDRETDTPLSEAVFGLYTKEPIYYIDSSGNTQTISADTLVLEATSGEDGIASFQDESLPLGKYYIKELQAPRGYATNTQILEVDCTYAGQGIEKIEKQMDFTDKIVKLKIDVTDYETNTKLVGTEFVLKDENGNMIDTYTIEENKEIEVKGLEVGKQYRIEEVKSRDGYVKDLLIKDNTEDPNELTKTKEANGLISFTIKDSEQQQKVTISNLAKVGQLEVEKTGEVLVSTEQGENENRVFHYETQRIDTAKFEIYAKENINHPDGTQGRLISAGTKIGEGQTQNGILTITKIQENLIQEKSDTVQLLLNRGLPLGEYVVKETEAPEGYLLNQEEQTKTVKVEVHNDTDQVERTSVTINNQRQKVQINITKKDREEEKPLAGAEFGLYTKEPIHYKDGSEAIPKDTLVLKATSGEDGIASFQDENLPLGKYYIKELQAPQGYATNPETKDIDCTYQGQTVNQILTETDFTNKIITLKIKVVDYETDVGLRDTQISLKDENGNTIDTYTVDTQGEIEVKGLEVGKQYSIEQIKQRNGYVKDLLFENNAKDPNELSKGKDANGFVMFEVKDSQETQTVTVSNLSKVGQLQIEKTGEVLVSVDQDADENFVFHYETQRIDTAKFEIYAKEDIAHPDGQQGVILPAGTKIGEGQTQNGILTISKVQEELIQEQPEVVQLLLNRGLPLGEYEIKETEAPEGYVLDSKEQTKTAKLESRADQDKVEMVTITVNNLRKYTNIGKPDPNPENPNLGVYKTDVETGKPIAGAEFGLYAAEDILGVNHTILIPKDTLIEKATTNQDGYAKFKADLPIGKYYIVEIKPATGYIENHTKLEIDSTTIASTEQEYPVKIDVQNKKTEINIEKVEKTEDLTQRERIVGAKLQVLDEEGKLVEEWTTDEEPHNIQGLETEKEYTLQEIEPAKGYVTAEDIKFTIDTEGNLKIGESYTIEGTQIPTIVMQDDTTKVKVTIVDKETKEPIKDIVVQLVDKNTGEVVYEYTTDGEEHVIEKIPIGDYEIVEKEYPKNQGYLSAEGEITVKDIPEVQEAVIEQDYTKLDINLIDEITKKSLPGGKLEIRNDKNEVVAIIDDTGVHYYKERLPVGKYTIVEVEVPEGYEKAENITFMLEDKPEIQYVTMPNKRLPFDLSVEKYASEVLINGTKQAGANQVGKVVKIDINGKNISVQDIEVVYTIKIINSGKVAGSVGKVVDQIPSGLKFNASKNENYWKVEGKNIVTTAFANQKIQPGETIELKMTLDWTKSEFNLGEKVNVVTLEGVTSSIGFEEQDVSNNSSSATMVGSGFDEQDVKNNSSSSSIIISVNTGLETVLTKQIMVIVLGAFIVIGMMALIEIKLMKRRKY